MPDLLITQAILSLGSNFHAEQNLANADKLLHKDFTEFSNIIIQGHDFSPPISTNDIQQNANELGRSNQGYLNQIAWIKFSHPTSFTDFIKFTKFLETKAQRHCYTRPIVTLDIDILVIELNSHRQLKTLTKHASQFVPLSPPSPLLSLEVTSPTAWYAIARRLPFADYDKFGINYLLTSQLNKQKAFFPLL